VKGFHSDNRKSFTYLDRYRNEGTRTYSEHAGFTEAHEVYRPDSKQSHVKLPVFEIPQDEMLFYTANPQDNLEKTYFPNSKALFCVHPQVLKTQQHDLYLKRTLSIGTRCRDFTVIPSSSTRTLNVCDHEPLHAVKLHFPFRISRYGRRMRDEVIEQALNISRELENGINQFDDNFGFLREVIGVVHKNLQPGSPRGENWGYLIREMTPYPNCGEKRNLIPGFALYGKDFFDPDLPPLLFDLIGECEPLKFVLEKVMFPIIQHWVQCFLFFGYLLEPHGQNVLFEVNQEKEVTRIIHRDLSLGIDMRRRRDLNLSEGDLNNYNRMETDDFHSITYDKFMGSHFFDRIVETCRIRFPNLKKSDFTDQCQDEFVRIFPAYEEYLPKTIRYFSEQRDSFNKPFYQDTGISPEWRP